MKKLFIIHPFLFAIFPILFLFSHNIGQVSFSAILSPSAIVLGFTLLLVLLLRLILRDSNKAGIIVSIFLVLFFSYGHIYSLGLTWHMEDFFIGRHRYLMPIWGIIFLCSAFFIIRIRKNLRNLTNILNITALSLVAISLINIGVYEFKTRGAWKDTNRSMGAGETNVVNLENTSNLPDVYYIILDGYASSNTLKEIYDYDNYEFTDYLTKKGFSITPESQSNYAGTSLSLASSLNMEYINYLSDVVGVDSKNIEGLDQMIKNSKVMNFLKARGYKFIYFSSSESELLNNEFLIVLVQTTMLGPFKDNFFTEKARKKALDTFSELAEMHRTEGPKFIFAHILPPHPPFIFGANGEPAPKNILKMGGWAWTEKEKYLNQLIFVNKKIEALVDEILSKSEVSPIIVLQADHGPAATLSYGFDDGWHRPTETMIRERMGIFNAYYLPGGGNDLLFKSITPVNTFRVIFNFYFNMDYELLDDQSYFSSYDQPYKFINVTDKLKHD